MGVILNIGIILSFFLGVLLFTKKNKTLSDKILAVWLIIIGMHLLNYWFYNQGYWEEYPHLIGITVPFPFFHGPLLLLYVVYSQKTQKHLRLIDYLHFTPIMLSYLYMLPFYFTYSAEDKIKVDKGLINDYSVFSTFLAVCFIISGLCYVIITYNKLLQRKKIIIENFSYNEHITLNWLRYTILCFACIFVTAGIVVVFRELLGFEFQFPIDIIFYSFAVIFVIYVGYSGIKQQGIFSNNIIDEQDLAPVKSESEYKNSGLKKDTAVSKHSELLELMEKEKPYLNPKLTLNDLSQKLSISSNHLSQIINQYEQVNFHDFINKYRVEEFIERATSNNNFSLLAHAFDSGFNSKSSFNSVFKKFKQNTPGQYLNQVKK